MTQQGSLQFGGAASPSRVGNRRITIRYRCAPAAAGKVVTAEDREFQRAWIDNLSQGGVGLFVGKPIPEGSVVVVQLKAPVGDNVYDLNGQVMHSILREPYGWYLGIEFIEPLSNDALDAIL